MARITLTITAILLLAVCAVAQPLFGTVTGVVNRTDGTPVRGAEVELAGVNGGNPAHHAFFHSMTNQDGTFGFRQVPTGTYSILAHFRMDGFASQMIEVTENQTTNVTLTLNTQPPDSEGHGHHGNGDSLVAVELTGTAVVVHPDTAHPRFARYGLDVDGDGTIDYRLNFGPPWYVPASGAVRPQNGDQISITGGLFTYTTPPVVIVFTINGLAWRQPGRGHGGNGGGDHQRHGCNPDSVTRVEFEGHAIVRTSTNPGPHGEHTLFACNVSGDSLPEYLLDFGRPGYVPPSGATRPANGDQISIVGGQIYCPNVDPAAVPIVLVYEINGLLWREPGDTIGLGAITESVTEPYYVGEATTYLTARNYPNPFNPTTTISYSIPAAGSVKVNVFDITGREVATLVNSHQVAGEYAVNWDANNRPSGIYFYRVSVDNVSKTFRMVLMK